MSGISMEERLRCQKMEEERICEEFSKKYRKFSTTDPNIYKFVNQNTFGPKCLHTEDKRIYAVCYLENPARYDKEHADVCERYIKRCRKKVFDAGIKLCCASVFGIAENINFTVQEIDEYINYAQEKGWTEGKSALLELKRTANGDTMDDINMPLEEINLDDWKFKIDDYARNIKIMKYLGSETFVSIPRIINGYPVEIIGERAFESNENLQEVIIPEGITEIKKQAFVDCKSLESVTLPETLIEIGANAFALCTNLKDINIPKSVKTIAGYAFSGCKSLEAIVLPYGITTIGRAAFAESGLVNVCIPGSVKIISTELFDHCSKLKEVVLDEGVEKIRSTFYWCTSLISVQVPQTVKSDFEKPSESSDFTVKCVEGSRAHKCAEKNGMPVEFYEPTPVEVSADVSPEGGALAGKVFAAVGTMVLFKSRDNIKKYIEENGGTLLKKVSGKANYFIIGKGMLDYTINEGKNRLIPRISEDELVNMVNNATSRS